MWLAQKRPVVAETRMLGTTFQKGAKFKRETLCTMQGPAEAEMEKSGMIRAYKDVEMPGESI